MGKIAYMDKSLPYRTYIGDNSGAIPGVDPECISIESNPNEETVTKNCEINPSYCRKIRQAICKL
jgi:hypothetical protein